MTEPKRSNLKDNPHYIEGQWYGRNMAKRIDSTPYKTLELAIKAKREFSNQLETLMDYTLDNWEYVQNWGIIHSLEDALK